MLTITEEDIRKAVDEIKTSELEKYLTQEPTARRRSRRTSRSSRSRRSRRSSRSRRTCRSCRSRRTSGSRRSRRSDRLNLDIPRIVEIIFNAIFGRSKF